MKHFNYLKQVLLLLALVLTGYQSGYAVVTSGVYTIGGTTPNYATITAAVSDLNGSTITGPVIFNIRGGAYAEQVIINPNLGASATNTITFQAESGKGTVTVTAAGSSTTNNYIFRLNGANYVTIKNLTLNNTGSTYGACIDLVGTASNNTIEGCKMMGSTTNTTSQYKSRIYANGHTGSNNVFTADSILNGSYGAYWRGSSTSSRHSGNVITGCTFYQTYYYGIYNYYSYDFEASNNIITSTGVSSYYALYNYYAGNRLQIKNNTVTVTGTSSMYALYMYYCIGDAVNAALRPIARDNNITMTTTSGDVTPLYNAYSPFDSVVNNSLITNTSYTYGSATSYMCYNCPDAYVANNQVTGNGNYYLYRYGIYYSPRAIVKKNVETMKGGNSGYVYNYGIYYSDYASYDSNTTSIQKPTGSSGYWYTNGTSSGWMYYSNYANMRGNDITQYMNNGNYYMYTGGMYYSRNATFTGNNVKNYYPTTSYYLYDYMCYYSDSANIDGNTIVDSSQYYVYGYTNYYSNYTNWTNNNIRTNFNNGGYYYNYAMYYSAGVKYDNNTLTYNNSGSGYMYDYWMYAPTNAIYTRNTKRVNLGTGGGYYGYTYQGSSAYAGALVANNDISVLSTGSSVIYGLYLQYPNFMTFYNNVVNTKTNGTNYTAYIYYPYGGENMFYNNTFNSAGNASTNYTLYDYNPGSYGGTTKYVNNIISRQGSSGYPPLCFYNPANSNSDYNNIYAPSGTLVQSNTTFGGGTSWATLQAWRSAGGYDKNSLSYDPGFMNASIGDLRPDPANPAAWSVNGRGIHIAGNTTDRSGAPRAVTPGAGVPDLGAYEFVPASSPPAAVMTPATITAGTTNTFTFGQDTVATITWDATAPVPTAVTTKQFSGAQAPNITTLNATYMYFYDSIGISGTGAFLYDVKNYYKDPWIGTIAAEASLHIAKRDIAAAGPWVSYPSTVSTVNTVRNFINTTGITNTFGYYTGIDVANNASAQGGIVAPSGSYCPGTYTVVLRIVNNGNNVINNVKIDWLDNANTHPQISYTTPIPVNNGTPNYNSALITLGSLTFGSAAIVIKAWTSLPNGQPDPISADDTLYQTLHSALAGVYTIGGTTPDYPNVVAAVSDLNTYGVCGKTTFNIRPGSYTGKLDINPVVGVNATNTVTFRSEQQNANGVNINYSAASASDNYVLRLNNVSYFKFDKLTFQATGSTYAYAVVYNGNPTNDTLNGCILTAGSATSTSTASLYSSGLSGSADNLTFTNNTFNGGYYYNLYFYGSSGNPVRNLDFEGNTVNTTGYYSYMYYCGGGFFRLKNNVFNSGPTTSYGLYFYNYGTPPANTYFDVSGNICNYSSNYGMMMYYPNGYPVSGTPPRSKYINNISNGSGTSTAYGGYMYYLSNVDIYNNVWYTSNTYASGYNVYMYMSSAPYNGNVLRNNAFINTGGGYAGYMYYTNASYGNSMDYNNFFSSSTGSKYVFNGTQHTTFNAFRAATGEDKNSLSYNPQLTIDGKPDVNNPACWALNGRGVQIATNTTDKDGNPRPATLAAGVPDIGAYEFEPQSIPPDADVTPTTPATPGSKQYYLFGFDTVAAVTWNPALGITSPLSVKLYSGRQGPGFTAISPAKYMYFYTDITPTGTGTTFDFNPEIYYYDSWLGTMPSEPNIKLAHKSGINPWVAYNGANSATNGTRNIISAAGLTAFGAYTGIDTNTIFSAIVKPKGSTIFCTGGYVILKSSTVGTSYQWNKNGNVIPGATADSFMATTAGDYSVTIVSGTNSATSIPITVTTVSAPMAIVNANGPLTYCTGGALQLSAGTGAGLSYQWQVNGNNINGATNPTYNVSGPGTYTVIVKNIGCGTTSPAAVVTPGPLNVNLGLDTTFCEVKNQAFTLNAGYPGAKYAWSTGDTTQTLSVFGKPGKYFVTVNAGPNCIAADTITLNIKPLPNITGISYIGAGKTYTFNTAGAQNSSSYLWMFGDGTTSTQGTVTKTFDDGNVIVRLIAFNECGSDTSVLIAWATNVTNTSMDGYNVSLYPNPASDNVTVSLEGNVYLKDVIVLNSIGQVVYKQSVDGNTKSLQVDVARFANGHYMLRAVTTEGTVSKPFNIVR